MVRRQELCRDSDAATCLLYLVSYLDSRFAGGALLDEH
jgi:hypothetical protein